MPSTYTDRLGLEKIAEGEQTGAWSGTVNTNWDIVDQSVNGIVSITLASAGTSGSPNTLVVTDGALSDGRNAHVEYVDGGDLGADAYVRFDPNDAEKLVIIKNSLSGGRDLYVFQGTYDAGRDYVVRNGKTAQIGFSGVGAASSVATNLLQNVQVASIEMDNTNTLGWLNAAGTDVVTIHVDGSDDILVTVNGTVALQYDLSGTSWDFKANGIATTGAISAASVGTSGNIAATGTVTGSNLSGTNTGDEVAASTTVPGVIELATQDEVNTGTDTTRAVTPNTLSNWSGGGGGTSSPLTTKGDIWGFSTVDARLPVGTNGWNLEADSSQSLGVKWAAKPFNKAASLENPAVNDELTIFFTEKAITISEIRSVLVGSSTPSITWTLRYGPNRSLTGTAIDSNTVTDTTTGSDITAIDNPSIPADSFIWLEIDAKSGTVTEVHLTIIGTID